MYANEERMKERKNIIKPNMDVKSRAITNNISNKYKHILCNSKYYIVKNN